MRMLLSAVGGLGMAGAACAGAVELYGNGTDGCLYSISPEDASVTKIGALGWDTLWPMEFSASGTLWAVEGVSVLFLTVDVQTGGASYVWGGNDQHSVGAFDFTPDGLAQTIETGFAGWRLNTFDMEAQDVVGSLVLQQPPFLNGSMSLEYRDDGAAILIANDGARLFTINTQIGTVTEFATFDASIGRVEGTTTIDGVTYVTTLGEDAPGGLYTLDLHTGATSLIGHFDGVEFMGLAAIPAPGGPSLAGLVLLLAANRRRSGLRA